MAIAPTLAGTNWRDILLDVPPPPPIVDALRLYASAADGMLHCENSLGQSAFPPATLAPGSVVEGGSF